MSGFEWDDAKAAANLEKHGVSFDEACSIFDDPMIIELYDIDHSIEEYRFLAVGKSRAGRLLIVSYTDRDDTIRLIGSRELDSTERRQYEKG